MKGPRGRWPANSLIGGLREPAREELLRLGVPVQYESGRVLLREGEQSDHTILLLDGCVKVTATTETGGVALLDIRVGGDLVGELATLDSQPRSATVTAAGPLVARLIQRSELLAFLEKHPCVAIAVGRGIGAKLRWATRRRVDFGAGSVRIRLVRVLAELVDTYGEPARHGIKVTTSLTQPELAGLVNAAEPTVHRALAALRREGIVLTGYRQVTVVDPDRLRSLARLSDEEVREIPSPYGVPRSHPGQSTDQETAASTRLGTPRRDR